MLFRTSHHSAMLEIELARRNIPFVKFGGLKFVEAAHVKDVLAVLRWAENPTDRVTGFRVVQMLEGIGPTTAGKVLDRMAGRVGASTRWRPSRRRPRRPSAWRDLVELMSKLRDADGGLAGAVRPGAAVVSAASRTDAIPTRSCGPVISISSSASPLATPSRTRFLTDLTLDPPSATSDEAGAPLLDEDYLILSTIHSAKGQEWKSVFVLNVVDGCIPSDMATGNADEIEEERRLLYVAMTRAKDQLALIVPHRFYVHNQARGGDKHLYASRSRFIPAGIAGSLRDAILAAGRASQQPGGAADRGHRRHRRAHAPDVARHRYLSRLPSTCGRVTWAPASAGVMPVRKLITPPQASSPRRRGPSAPDCGELLSFAQDARKAGTSAHSTSGTMLWRRGTWTRSISASRRSLASASAQVAAAVELLGEGATVPFIARYRKEKTGGLDDTQLRKLEERLGYLRELEDRRATVLKSIEEQGKLTPELRALDRRRRRPRSSWKTSTRPSSPSAAPRRRSRARPGSSRWPTRCWPTRRSIPQAEAAKFVDADKGVADAKAALDGARHILIERIGEDAGAGRQPCANGSGPRACSPPRCMKGKADGRRQVLRLFRLRPAHQGHALAPRARHAARPQRGRARPRSRRGARGRASRIRPSGKITVAFNIAERGRPADAWLAETVRLAWKAQARACRCSPTCWRA